MKMCEVPEVSRSGHYAWFQRPESARRQKNRRLIGLIRKIHEDHRRIYGSPRIHAVLRRQGESCSRNRVARLIKEAGIRARQKRKFKATPNSKHDLPVAQNLLNRNFNVSSPDTVWASDITYVATDEGWLYLATTLDLSSAVPYVGNIHLCDCLSFRPAKSDHLFEFLSFPQIRVTSRSGAKLDTADILSRIPSGHDGFRFLPSILFAP